MVTLDLCQFVYFRADAQTPGIEKPGFQFVWLSQTLEPSLLRREAANRMHFDERSPVRQKKVFFGLSDGSAVVSCATRSDQPGSDNRTGDYFHHGYVVSPRDFEAIANDPFLLFDKLQFWNCPEDAVDAKIDSNLPNVTVALPEPGFANFQPLHLEGFDPADSILAHLLGFSLDALTQRKAISVVGPQELIMQFGRMLWATMPLAKRRECWFDTDATGNQAHNLPCWLMGLPKTPGGFGLTLIDLEAKQLRFQRKDVEQLNPYQAWLKSCFERRHSPNATEVQAAWQISSLLTGQKSIPFASCPTIASLAELLWSADPARANREYEKQLSTVIGQTLAQRCAKSLAASEDANERLQSMQGNWQIIRIVDALWNSYLRSPRDISANEIMQLQGFIDKHQTIAGLLAPFYLAFTSQKDISGHLTSFSRSQYDLFTQCMFDAELISFESMFVQSYAETLVENALKYNAIRRSNIQSVRTLLKRHGFEELMEYVLNNFEKSSPRTTKSRPLASETDATNLPKLVRNVQQDRKSSSHEGSLISRLSRWFRGD
ncbi:MAG: hypothetical protein KDB03_01485 [Planctomycetales bacterium]|nr:hypothetical protein [Planctomycetales bacterium]